MKKGESNQRTTGKGERGMRKMTNNIDKRKRDTGNQKTEKQDDQRLMEERMIEETKNEIKQTRNWEQSKDA